MYVLLSLNNKADVSWHSRLRSCALVLIADCEAREFIRWCSASVTPEVVYQSLYTFLLDV